MAASTLTYGNSALAYGKSLSKVIPSPDRAWKTYILTFVEGMYGATDEVKIRPSLPCFKFGITSLNILSIPYDSCISFKLTLKRVFHDPWLVVALQRFVMTRASTVISYLNG